MANRRKSKGLEMLSELVDTSVEELTEEVVEEEELVQLSEVLLEELPEKIEAEPFIRFASNLAHHELTFALLSANLMREDQDILSFSESENTYTVVLGPDGVKKVLNK